MKVTAWNNGQHHCSGAGYGIKISISDRNAYFKKSWQTVLVTLPNGEEIEVNTNKKSFWDKTCRELIHKEIGKWLRDSGNAPWRRGCPPRFELLPRQERCFAMK